MITWPLAHERATRRVAYSWLGPSEVLQARVQNDIDSPDDPYNESQSLLLPLGTAQVHVEGAGQVLRW